MACALVVFLTSTFATVQASARAWQRRWIGDIDVQVSARGGGLVPETVVDRIRGVEGVRIVSARLHERAELVFPEHGRASVTVWGRLLPQEHEIRPQRIRSGTLLADPAAYEILIEGPTADELGLDLGDEVELRVYDDAWRFRVVGIISRPQLFAFIPPIVHVPLAAAQEMAGRPGRVDTVYVALEEGANAEVVAERIRLLLDDHYEVRNTADRSVQMERNLALWKTGLYVLGGLVFVLAMFLIFATLSCGLVQRIGELGTLRCLGASRRQVLQLVLYESLPLAVWAVVIGVPIGLVASSVATAQFQEDVLIGGWRPSVGGIVLGVLGSLGASLVGALLPAIEASRVLPIQAYRPRSRQPRPRAAAVAAAVGAVLLVVPLAWVYSVGDAFWALYGYVFLGIPLMVAGLFLITPAVFVTAGWLLAWICGVVLRIPPSLVAGQLRWGRWRSAAVATAVTMCVSLVVAVNTQTESLLAGSDLPNDFPDLLVIVPEAIDSARAEAEMARLGIDHWTGLTALDVDVVDARTRSNPTIMNMLMPGQQGNMWFIAFDPERMERVVDLRFLEGDAETAVRKLIAGDAVIVPEAFARAQEKHLGDTIPIRVGERIVEFEVAGVAESVSIEVAGREFNLNDLYLQNAPHTMLGPIRVAENYFGVYGYAVLFIDVPTVAAGDAVYEHLRHAWPDRMMAHMSLRRLKQQIDEDFRRLARTLSLIGGLLGGLVASVGVANAMQANVFSRRRELGVLHAVGMTRSQLVRLVLAEAILLGSAGAVLGVLDGIYASLAGLRVHALFLGAGARFTVPPGPALLAMLVAVGFTVVASVTAAYRASRANVLDLMQE